MALFHSTRSGRKRRGGAPDVEIAHGETIVSGAGEEVWNWSSPVGQVRLGKRIDLFCRSLGLDREKKRVLELGCGTGLYTREIAPFSTELVALDISDALLTEAKRKLSNGSVRFVRQNLERIEPELVGSGFTAAFGCSVLHHLDLDQTLPQLRNVLSPGADVAFSEPNLLNPHVRLIFSRFEWPRRRWGASKTEMAFYPWELKSIFRRHGFDVVEFFCYDFMHPAIPARLVGIARSVDRFLERTPLVRLLGGSCFIHARAPR
ncbi:MAG: class I SAM-dependent methyltransferase [Candidatus Binatia bacterium]